MTGNWFCLPKAIWDENNLLSFFFGDWKGTHFILYLTKKLVLKIHLCRPSLWVYPTMQFFPWEKINCSALFHHYTWTKMGQNKLKQLEISSEANSGKKEKLFMEHAFADSPSFCLRRCRITFWQNGGGVADIPWICKLTEMKTFETMSRFLRNAKQKIKLKTIHFITQLLGFMNVSVLVDSWNCVTG